MVSFLTYCLSPILDGHLLEVRDACLLYAMCAYNLIKKAAHERCPIVMYSVQ